MFLALTGTKLSKGDFLYQCSQSKEKTVQHFCFPKELTNYSEEQGEQKLQKLCQFCYDKSLSMQNRAQLKCHTPAGCLLIDKIYLIHLCLSPELRALKATQPAALFSWASLPVSFLGTAALSSTRAEDREFSFHLDSISRLHQVQVPEYRNGKK